MWDMARDDLQFRLRIPEELKGQIAIAAAENNRSMTAEIISRLQDSFETGNTLDELWKRVDELEVMVLEHDRRIRPEDHEWD